MDFLQWSELECRPPVEVGDLLATAAAALGC
jgi:hypothetical protein